MESTTTNFNNFMSPQGEFMLQKPDQTLKYGHRVKEEQKVSVKATFQKCTTQRHIKP